MKTRDKTQIYSWFTEGFDTAELQEAKTLLRSWKGKQEERAKERAEQASAQRPLPASVQEPAIALLQFLLAASSLLEPTAEFVGLFLGFTPEKA